ncbi:hypothetical protein B0T26DRAFT_3996 [Lasiosphaeria miniovina]|uniref:Myb/SANT-like domain-containing protein n=1 Tax=Lasiosphaeria miniovina TaxID=1954250 RepID=A0AA40ECB0_9PEZI|nr:uncharacterized protein B0T26DRAFT_3996 [Lasiosphaeria miniovina]KAK0733042.1 hypothetical protein B0T26DRAFT_3996 [Lasiosphaeria miniovina]
MTAQVMLWFRDCKNQCFFNGSKKRDYGPAWDTVLSRCQQLWPQFPWSKNTVLGKYDTERRRYQAFEMLLGYSGVSYNYDTRLPETSDTTWESFFMRNNTRHRDHGWLRYTPLGDRDVYEVVFWREQASGFDIVEAADLQAISLLPVDSGDVDSGEDSGRDNPELLDADDVDDILARSSSSSRAVSTPTQRLTPAQRHRLETDPDQTPPRNSTPPISVPPTARVRKTAQSESGFLGESFSQAAIILAEPKLAGAGDIAAAWQADKRVMECLEHW